MATNYTEKIAKVEEAIAKKENTIVKKTALIEKKKVLLGKTSDENEKRWIQYDIDGLMDDIKRLGREIEEKKQIISNYETKRANEQKRFDLLAEMPVCFTEFRDRIVAEMDSNDKAMKYTYLDAKAKRDTIVVDAHAKMKANEITYTEYKKIVHEAYENKLPMYQSFFDKSDEQIHLDNLKVVTEFVLGTCHRVIAITGEITDTQSVRITCGNQGHAVINGFIIGKDGEAELETIECAGYNIVRWHLRTIVHDRTPKAR